MDEAIKVYYVYVNYDGYLNNTITEMPMFEAKKQYTQGNHRLNKSEIDKVYSVSGERWVRYVHTLDLDKAKQYRKQFILELKEEAEKQSRIWKDRAKRFKILSETNQEPETREFYY